MALNRIDLRLIRAFCAVYEEGSISKAAARLHVAQPNVSVAIKNLEFDLHTTLFERSASGARPTQVTHAFYSRLQKALAELDAAHQAVAGAVNAIGGPLRVGLPPMLAKIVLPTLLPTLLDDYPDLDLQCVEGSAASLIDLASSGEIDLAVVLRPPPDPKLTSRWIAAEPLVLVASVNNPIELTGRADLSRLPPLKLALPWGQGSVRSLIDNHIASGDIPVGKIVGLDAFGPIIDLIRHTDWMTILPAGAVTLDLADLAAHMIDVPGMSADYYVIRPGGAPLTAAAELFIEEIERSFERTALAWHRYFSPRTMITPVRAIARRA